MATSETTHAGAAADRVLTAATLPYYLGGFLGPFGSLLVISIYPELRETFDASTEAVNWSFSGYFIPMAALMLVSGTIGERYGRRRVTRLTFLAYGSATVLCVLAPTLGLFLAARVLQGLANAFISPLLLAGLTEVTAPARLGRAIGVYSSFQAAGGALGPFAGGLAARADWRIVFGIVAVVAFVLSTRPPPGEPRPAAAAPPIRPLLKPRMALLWIASFSAAAGPLGVSVIVGLYMRDELGVGSEWAGLVLLLGGLAAMAVLPTWGRLLDEWGPLRSSAVSAAIAVAVTAPLGLLTQPAVFGAAWVVVFALISFVLVNIQNLPALAVPANRGGALSSVMAFRFSGHAIGPLVWVPVFAVSPAWAFAGSALLGLVTLFTLTDAARRVAAQAAAERS